MIGDVMRARNLGGCSGSDGGGGGEKKTSGEPLHM